MSIFDLLPWVRARRSRELADEIRAHLEMAEADRIGRGESAKDAAFNARREFGNTGLVREVASDQWGVAGRWMDDFGQDVRFALRALRRSPAFAAAAALTIAFGVGATTAIFSVVNAALLHPLPYPHADRLVRIEDDQVGLGARDIGMSTPEWHDLQRSGIFSAVSPTWYDDNNLTGLARAQRVSLLIVAPNYFTLLGMKPKLGAVFDPHDDTPGFNGQAVISDGLWKRAFGGDSGIVGRVVQLDSDSYRIVGVMPSGFQAPARSRDERGTEVWVAFGYAGAPLSEASVQSRASLFPSAIARLQPQLTVAEAQRRIDVFVASLRRQHPADYPPQSDWRIRLVPLQESVTGDVRQPLLFLFGAVGLLLLIGCANVASLLLVRATARGREIAVRQALGGSSWRLMRQLLTESVVLSLLGGGAGIVLVAATKASLVQLVPDSVPRLNDIAIDWSVLAFGLAGSIIAGAVFGLAPAFHARGLDVNRVLKDDARGTSASGEQRRVRRMLVVVEFSLSLVLLCAAGLLFRSFRGMLDAPLGFDPHNVTIVHTRLPYPNDPKEDLYPDVAGEARFAREVAIRLRALPGVEQVALGSGAAVPLGHPYQDQNTLRVLFERGAQGTQPVLVTGSIVTPEYFGLLGMYLVRGRLFNAFDTDSTPSVAVINEAMGRTFWPNDDPIGKRVRLSTRSPAWTTIVGIVENTRSESLASSSDPQMYVSLFQRQGKHLAIFLRGHVEAASIARQVREQIQSINPALPVFGAESLDETVGDSLAVRRLALELLGLFAVTAMFLAALGIYGVISYMVSERTHEIGLRVALGAGPAEILRLVMRQGVALALAGAAIGVAGALLVARAMGGLLVGVSPADPLTFAAATIVLTLVALAGCYVPARRAIRVDPIVALRA
jgi:predicted permease